jgi:Flp pilus assembly pilin Flp
MSQPLLRILLNRNGEKGATMVEYAKMAVLVAIAVIASVKVLGTNVSIHLSSAAVQLN